MTNKPPAPRLRLFENSPGQRHIGPPDHYLYARPAPDYRLGLIGTGTMGQEHMRVAALLGRARVHGIFDHRAQSLDAALAYCAELGVEPPRRHESLASLVADDELDALFICTPNHSHLDVLRQLMATGKPLFLEKPMATTLEDGRELAALARDYDGIIQLGLQYRFKAPYVEAWHEVRERKSLGAVHTVSMSEYRPPFLDKVAQWNKFSSLSGGTLVEKCCHYFDLMGRFAGASPRRVYASGGQAVNFRDFDYQGQKADVHDHAFVTIDYANGVRGSFTLNMFAPAFHEELVLVGDRGRLLASERFDVQRPQEAESRVRVETHEPGATRDSVVAYGAAIEESGHHGATYHEHIAFLDQLDGRATDAATVRDGLWSMLVAVAAQDALATGQAVQIDALVDRYRLGSFLE